MKKVIALIGFMFVLSLCLSACAEKAKPIKLPTADEITSIEIGGGIEDIICTEKEQIVSFIEKLNKAKPTSKESVQDVPTVAEYTRVDIVSNGNMSSVFIYEENSKWYVEQPYQGIYETDETVLKLLKD